MTATDIVTVVAGGVGIARGIIRGASRLARAGAAVETATEAAETTKAVGSAVKGEAGLTTPGKFFRNLTKADAEAALGNKLGAPRSVRPEAKTYYNSRTKRSFNVHEEPGHQGGKPHVDVRRRGSGTERKYPLKENLE